MAANVHGRRDAVTNAGTDRTPAQWYDLVVGAVLLLVGIVGFFVNSSFATGDAAGGHGDDLIIFHVNGWHNVVHVLSGVFLLAMAGAPARARIGAITFGVIYGVVTLWGLIDGNDVLGLVAIDGADNVLHIVLTLSALAAGFAPRSQVDVRRDAAATPR